MAQIKFITVPDSTTLSATPYYIGLVQHERTLTNKTEGAKPVINTVLDETTREYDVITGTHVFSIAGADLAPVVPPVPTAEIDEIGQSFDGGDVNVPDRWNREQGIMAKGANLFFDPEMGDKIEIKYVHGSEIVTSELPEDTYERAADHGSVYILSEAYPTTLEAGIDIDVVFTTHAGVAGSPAQTLTKRLTYNEP